MPDREFAATVAKPLPDFGDLLFIRVEGREIGEFIMDNGVITTSDLLRLTGIMGVCVGLAWAFQVLGFGGASSGFDQLMWVIGAAAIAGAGVGTIYTATRLADDDLAVQA